MNSTECYIAAGKAIRYYRMTHNNPCLLYVEKGRVCCKQAREKTRYQNNPLYVSKFEIDRGMRQNRWDVIGTALHNLYCKELACQAHQKP